MYHFYNPYDQYTQAYTMYTSTTTVPTYTLQQTLMSLSNRQSRIFEQRQQLAEEEERLRRLRAATVQRIRAQRLREVLEETDDAEFNIFELGTYDDNEDQVMRDAVMYEITCRRYAECACREILDDARARKMSEGLPSSREFQREIQIREMLDPSPRGPGIQFHVPTQSHNNVHQARHSHFQAPQPTEQFADTPVVDELPPHFTHPFATQAQYIPETPSFINKRGSRRNSVRRESRSVPEFPPAPSTVTLTQTIQSFNQIRAKLQIEYSTIPAIVQSNTPPTDSERKTLSHNLARLQDILDETDAVPLPTDSTEDIATARKLRRDIVKEIVTTIDRIENFIQPVTPTGGSLVGAGSVHEDSDDGEENVLFDEEIQRIIKETLARKRDEEIGSRRSVTVEDVPDPEY